MGMGTDWLTTIEAAAHVKRTVGALRELRARGTGPAYYRTGRRIYYRAADLDSWILAGRVQTAAAAARPAARRRTRAA